MASSGTVLFQKGQEDDGDIWDDSELIQQYEKVSKDFKKSLKKAMRDKTKKELRSAERSRRTDSKRHVTDKQTDEQTSDAESVRSSNEELNDMMKWVEWLKPVDSTVREVDHPWSAGDRCWAPFHTDGLMYPASVLRTNIRGQRTVVTVEFFGWANRVTLDARWLRVMSADWKHICPDRKQPPGRPPPPAVRRALLTHFPHLAASQEPASDRSNGALFNSMPPPPPPLRGGGLPSGGTTGYPHPAHHPACDERSNGHCSCVTMFDLLTSPPPLPPTPSVPEVTLEPEHVTSALLHSWYSCGYKSGYLQGYLEAKKELLGQKHSS